MISRYLKDRKAKAIEIVDLLSKDYDYVSIFGRHAIGKRYLVTSQVAMVSESNRTTDTEAGFVIKVYNKDHYSEYSLDDIDSFDVDVFKKMIELKDLHQDCVKVGVLADEPLIKSFERIDEAPLPDGEIMAKIGAFKDYLMACDEKIVFAGAVFMKREISSIFISKNRQLEQSYGWNNCMGQVVAQDGDVIKTNFTSTYSKDTAKALADLDAKKEDFVKISLALLDATPIEPGIYDVITAPSISGLIAHEAFGHGVEMDMFVKNRAKAKDYVGKKVASPLVNMHDGAAAALSSASYFFDDDGVIAQDTCIIKDGILQNGMSDVLSACILGTEPTGNSRRESTRRKAYTRMTNTFFLAGKDKVEDMFSSIKHGYYLCDTNNGMEDPKNWNIQCTAQYGLEIVDGKFTGKVVSPVVMSGNVLDVLDSISMVSDKVEVIGSGMCGKGHKEWVYVSDGGPYLKARVKLG